MKIRKPLLIVICLLCITIAGSTQATKEVDSLLIGLWKGSSICQVKNSPCHDEIIVYYISKTNNPDSFNIQMNKIVKGGTEEEMGLLPCIFDRKNNQLSSTAFNGIWNFKLKADSLEGTLVFRGELFRVIKVFKLHAWHG